PAASPVLFCAVLAALGAFGLGVVLGRRLRLASEQGLRAEIETWRSLANELHAENGRLRCENTPAPASGEPPSGKPNALASLRARLNFGRGEVAQALGIPIPDVETLEHTQFGLLEIATVASYVRALGCRLDVVAQHIDGEAVWLSDAPDGR